MVTSMVTKSGGAICTLQMQNENHTLQSSKDLAALLQGAARAIFFT
jgi:hypothetical protein